MFGHLDLHVRRRLDESEGGVVGVSVEQSERYGDVVVLALVRHWDRPHQVQQLPLTAVVEDELLSLGSQALVVMDQSLHVLLGEVRVPVAWLHAGEEAGQESVVTVRRRHFDDI